MIVICILIPLSILTAACFLGGFIWAVRSGQFEDTSTPAFRMLADEPNAKMPQEAPPKLEVSRKLPDHENGQILTRNLQKRWSGAPPS